MNDKKLNLIIRTITGVLFVIVMVAGFLTPTTMVALFALITALALWEYTGLVNNFVADVQVNRLISTVAGVYFFLAVAGWRTGMVNNFVVMVQIMMMDDSGSSYRMVNNFVVMVPYILSIVYLLISELYTGNKNAVADMAYTMLGQMYIAMPLSLINILAFEVNADATGVHYNMLLPLCVFIFLWLNDSGAYCTGSLLGKHKLFPRISPGKTWEGSIGGGVIVIIAAFVIGLFANESPIYQLNEWQWAGLGLVVVVFGTWGDLVESLFKRTLGIKDSGKILPGHGGMLDRFDSSLMAIPAAVMYLYTLVSF